MTYASTLQNTFRGVELDIDDIYLLESYQIAYLPNRVPKREFAAVLWAEDCIKRFLIAKHPPISNFVGDVMARYGPAVNQQDLDTFGDELVWEIADQIIYCKHPDVYDERVDRDWLLDEVTSIVSLETKVVIDAGAGTGQGAFACAEAADLVFAVEPNASLRQFIREKAAGTGLTNLYAVDGFLHSIPLPDGFADVLITSNAVGWQLENELLEIERIVKAGGHAIHLISSDRDPVKSPLHHVLTSAKWRYEFTRTEEPDSWKTNYWKQI